MSRPRIPMREGSFEPEVICGAASTDVRGALFCVGVVDVGGVAVLILRRGEWARRVHRSSAHAHRFVDCGRGYGYRGDRAGWWPGDRDVSFGGDGQPRGGAEAAHRYLDGLAGIGGFRLGEFFDRVKERFFVNSCQFYVRSPRSTAHTCGRLRGDLDSQRRRHAFTPVDGGGGPVVVRCGDDLVGPHDGPFVSEAIQACGRTSVSCSRRGWRRTSAGSLRRASTSRRALGVRRRCRHGQGWTSRFLADPGSTCSRCPVPL